VVSCGRNCDLDALRARVGGRLIIGCAEASPEIGWGHVRRLGALLTAWCEVGGRAQFVADGIEGTVQNSLVEAGVEILAVETTQIEGLVAECRRGGACATALDGYHFSREDVMALQRVGSVLALDDLAGPLSEADLVVNQNLDFPRNRYSAASGTVLIGSDYVLLPPEFRQALETVSTPDRERVLVTFGGSDPTRLSLPVCEELCRRLSADYSIDLILGPGVDSEVADRCVEFSQQVGCQRLAVHKDVNCMSILMGSASVAISAAGSTTWELLAMGVVPVLAAVSENQRSVAESTAARGVAVSAGSDPVLLVRECQQLLTNQERRMKFSRRGQELIDGRGVWRVMDDWLGKIERSKTAP